MKPGSRGTIRPGLQRVTAWHGAEAVVSKLAALLDEVAKAATAA